MTLCTHNFVNFPDLTNTKITQVKEYSTKELNDLARKELLQSLKLKDKRKGSPRRRVNLVDNYQEPITDATTKNSVYQLKDLEEDARNVPSYNSADNNVIVVTKSPIT